MPEYLAPGVFVEEVSFRQKSIEGVSTSTTGFVGPTRFGPILGEPALLTSFADFERIYGGIDQLRFDGMSPTHNFVAHAVRAYFAEGGKRLYVARTFNPAQASDGIARWQPEESPEPEFGLRARYPGRAGNFRVRFRFRLGENILHTDPETNRPVLRGALNYDVVLAAPAGSPAQAEVYWAERFFDETVRRETFRLRRDDPGEEPGSPGPVSLDEVSEVRVLTATVTVGAMGRFGEEQSWENLSFHPDHRSALTSVFAATPERRSTELYVPLVFTTDLANGAAIAEALLARGNVADGTPIVSVLRSETSPSDEERSFEVVLSGGNDGELPGTTEYEGEEGSGSDARKSGLRAFEDLEDISIVAAPGSTFRYNAPSETQARAVTRLLISHCERMRYRVAVLDSIDGQLPADVRALRAEIDSTRAALYYPWVRVTDPLAEGEVREIHLPPSGFVTGIYARNDIDRGVHKAPANEVVRLAVNLEFLINKAQQEALNPAGINCLRFFEGRGFRVWGARTASSDPEWKYVNVRRYFAFLERSIEKGTQWAVFEPNGPALWSNVRRTVGDFLYNEFVLNHLAGRKPEEAYFVRCDETTMTQNDLDNGRLVCLIGVAPLRPAEFVIFRIGQKTADARS